jgi:hypothetical protein
MAHDWAAWKDFEIKVPAGCKVIPVPERDMVVVYPSGLDPDADVSEPAFSLSIRAQGEGTGALADFAQGKMRDRVGSGQPERFDTLIAGAPAIGFVWVDGVAKVTSWFLDVGRKRYEVQFSKPLFSFAPGREVSEALGELVNHLRLI